MAYKNIFIFFVWYQEQSSSQLYTQLNITVPILALFFSGGDLKPALRLSRESFNRLLALLPRQKAHGWSHEVEVLVAMYWLTCGASYRATADAFGMPLSTVCRTVHGVVEEMMAILHRVIHFPKSEEIRVANFQKLK